MSGGGRPEMDPMLRLQYYRETGQADQAKSYEQYLRETNQFKESGGDIHAQYRSGALAKRMAGANQRDRDTLAEEQENQGPQSAVGRFGHSLAATGANLAGGIPGMEAVQAGARSLVRRQPYREALSDIRGQEERVPGALRVGEQIAGGSLLAPLLPGGAIAKGALFGGATGALQADPDASRGEAGLLGSIIGGGLGYAGGKVAGKIAKPLSRVADKAKNALVRRGVGGMDILPEAAPKPQAPVPKPPGPVAPRPPTPPPQSAPSPSGSSSLDAELNRLVNIMRQQAPAGEEVGNAVGDAELASQLASPKRTPTGRPGHPIWHGGGTPTRHPK